MCDMLPKSCCDTVFPCEKYITCTHKTCGKCAMMLPHIGCDTMMACEFNIVAHPQKHKFFCNYL
jgi:hypothetical protein